MTKLNKDERKTKNCPFCGEQIFLEAIKCRYCGEFLSDKDAVEHPSIGSATESTALEPVKQTYRAKSLEEMKVGFGWGNVWIVFSFFYGAIFIVAAVINILDGIYPLGIGLLFISALPIGSGIGLLKRKRIGLHLTYVGIGLGLIGGWLEAVQKSFGYQEPFMQIFGSILGGSLVTVISLLWFRYFLARKNCFKQ